MRRLDKAYAAFFRRLQGGEKPGYPRFKVAGRYDSMEFPAYGDGLRLQEKLRIQHVGQVKVKQYRGMEGAIRSREEFAARTSSPSSFEVVPSLRSDCCGKPQHQGDVAEPQTQSSDCRCRLGRLSGNPAMQG
jgi:hypothetical protein